MDETSSYAFANKPNVEHSAPLIPPRLIGDLLGQSISKYTLLRQMRENIFEVQNVENDELLILKICLGSSKEANIISKIVSDFVPKILDRGVFIHELSSDDSDSDSDEVLSYFNNFKQYFVMPKY